MAKAAGSSEGPAEVPRVKRQYKRRGLAPAADERLCGRGCGQAVHRGNCKGTTNRGVKRVPKRAAMADGEIRTFPAPGLTELRERWQGELDRAETAYATAKLRLETLDEILGVLG